MTHVHNEEEKNESQRSAEGTMQNVGYLRVQAIEETKAEAFMVKKTDNLLARRE